MVAPTIDDVMNCMLTCRSSAMRGNVSTVTPVGPRTLGSDDTRWVADCESLHGIDRTIDAYRKNNVDKNINKLLIEIAAAADDPRLAFDDAKTELTSTWITKKLKPAYQSTRFCGKKPWPEFLAALMHPECLSTTDCCALSTLFGVHIGLIDPDGELIIPSAVQNSELDRRIIDATRGSETEVGCLISVAWSRIAVKDEPATKMKDLKNQIRALGMSDDGGPRAVLASRVSSRLAALRAYEGQRPTS